MEHSFKECIKLCVLCILVASIDRFPFHEAIFAGSNCTGFGGHLVTHNADGVINEHGRDFLHVVAGAAGMQLKHQFLLWTEISVLQ